MDTTQAPSASGLWTLGYASVARRKPGIEDLEHILAASLKANPEHGVTGLLLHCDGTFLQVLEGPRHGVAEIYRRIRANPLHADIVVLFDHGIDAREFGDWAMACEQVQPAAFDRIAHAPAGGNRRLLSEYWRAWSG